MTNPGTHPKNRPAGTGTQRPRRLAAPLFTLALATGLITPNLTAWLAPVTDATDWRDQTLPWPASASAQTVRRVVIDVAGASIHATTTLRWDDRRPPQASIRHRHPQSPHLHWVHEGDTLYLRQPHTAPNASDAAPDTAQANSGSHASQGPVVKELRLPATVHTVHGLNLEVALHTSLPRLQLMATKIEVDGSRIGQLHAIAMPQPQTPTNAAAACKDPDDATLSLREVDADDVRIEAMGGSVHLHGVRTPSLRLHTTPDTLLNIHPIGMLPQLHWQALDKGRTAQILELGGMDGQAHAPAHTPASGAQHACTAPSVKNY